MNDQTSAFENKADAIRQVVQWMDLDRRCGGYAGHCLKCDGVLQRKFDTADRATRKFIADVLCSCSVEDFLQHNPLQWLLALVESTDYERFVASLTQSAPFSTEAAWGIIQMSEHNKGTWCFMLEPHRTRQFQPRFHLHPVLAPLLLAATIRAGRETEDVIALFDYFEPVADQYHVLRNALPMWHAELERRAAERQAQEDRNRADWLRRQEQAQREAEQVAAEMAAKEVEYAAAEAQGPGAVITAILQAPGLGGLHCADRWASIPEKELARVRTELLQQLLDKLSGRPLVDHWRGFRGRVSGVLRSVAHTAHRTAFLARIEPCALPEKLCIACESKWSLTYFPESWVDAVIDQQSEISTELKQRMLSKVARLRKRSRWRLVRAMLQGRNRTIPDDQTPDDQNAFGHPLTWQPTNEKVSLPAIVEKSRQTYD